VFDAIVNVYLKSLCKCADCSAASFSTSGYVKRWAISDIYTIFFENLKFYSVSGIHDVCYFITLHATSKAAMLAVRLATAMIKFQFIGLRKDGFSEMYSFPKAVMWASSNLWHSFQAHFTNPARSKESAHETNT
jgi:hypothetical protein